MSVLLGAGNGTLAPQSSFAVSSTPYSVAVADVTADNKPEIVTANYGRNSLSVLVNSGSVCVLPL